MPRDSGPALRALGQASIVISLVAFTSFGIIGYSLYEETTYIIDNFNNLQPDMTTPIEDGIFKFKMNLTVPNKGLLPIHLMLGGEISSNSTIIGDLKQISETIMPNEDRKLFIDVPIDISSIKDGNISLSVNGSVSLQPFLSLGLATSIDFLIPGLDLSIAEDNIKITSLPINQINASHVLVPFNIQFTNPLLDSFKGDIRIVLISTPKTSIPSNYGETTLTLDLNPEEEFSENIEIVASENIVSSGIYKLNLIFSIEEQEVDVGKEVNIVCDICND
ncbi:MAG: hypothetical protein QF812_02145 [Nitrososphaerales archaeon]|nr:hypothetical protein [Nitrososphaerales archaeon]